MKNVTRISWKEFRESGLLWFVNRILHTFGLAIVLEVKEEEIINVYPARVRYRGFPSDIEEKGYTQVTNYLSKNITKLEDDIKE